jgi:hypothetical protein
MILVDANLLLHTYHPRAEQHEAKPSLAWGRTLDFPGSGGLTLSQRTVDGTREQHFAIARGIGPP